MFTGRMSPRGDRLVPLSIFFADRYMGIVQEYFSPRGNLRREVGGIGLVAAHMMCGVHAVVFAEAA